MGLGLKVQGLGCFWGSGSKAKGFEVSTYTSKRLPRLWTMHDSCHGSTLRPWVEVQVTGLLAPYGL